jgi:hypothetical protein
MPPSYAMQQPRYAEHCTTINLLALSIITKPFVTNLPLNTNILPANLQYHRSHGSERE